MAKMSAPTFINVADYVDPYTETYTDTGTNVEVIGPALPSFATYAYYQALAKDELQYGESAEYAKQFYGFIEDLWNQLYDAKVRGIDTISREGLYNPYKDNTKLANETNAFFNELFNNQNTASVDDILSSSLFEGAVQEYNRASSTYDFAAGWDSLGTSEQLVYEARQEDRGSFTEEEVRDYIQSRGINPDEVDYQDFISTTGDIQEADTAKYELQQWMGANTVTGKQFRAEFLAVNGREPTAEDYENFFGAGGTISSRTLMSPGSLTTEVETQAKENLWETQILPALEAGGDFVKTAIFGPSSGGGPKTVDEMFEEWMQSEMDQLKGPLTVTVDPNQGLLLEIMIPVNFEVNGSPLKIEIFDEDGNFVGVQEIGSAVWNAAEGAWGQIVDGVFTPIQEIFTGTEGNVVERIFDAAESVLATGGLSAAGEGGWLGGVLGELVTENLGFYNPETNTVENIESVSTEDLLNGDADLNGTLDGEIDDGTGLPVVEQQEEPEPAPTAKTPPGRVITDKQGNIVGISGSDGNFYIQDADGNWVVRPEGTGVGGETVLPTDTEVTDTGKKIIDTGGAPDVTGGTSLPDFDGDGVPDSLDTDADGDGIPGTIDGDDLDPNVGETFGPDIPTTTTDEQQEEDTGKNIIDTGGAPDVTGGTSLSDLDGDGVPDSTDTDADGDGVLGRIDGDDLDPNVGETFGPDEPPIVDYRDEPPPPPPPEEPSITDILFGTPDGLQLLGMLGGQKGVTPIKPEPFTPVDLPFQWQPEKPIGLFDYKDLNEALRKLTR